ncbi:MAG: ROK family protein [Eubacteriales bacterium]|nr:ROK family protein [Eubacteriales bacterium]
MENVYRIGIDIGGTKVNMGIIREDGTVLDCDGIASKGADDAGDLVNEICHRMEACLTRNHLTMEEIYHVGVGIPGTADYRNGIVRYSSNLFGTNVPLADYFQEHWQRRVTVVQDSWAAAWAEYLFGQKKKWPSMLCLTIGTGIGCGIILNGHVYGGAMNTAGEIGHTSIVPNGRLCSCGRRGCLETYASGTAILEQALERFPEKLKDLPQKGETVFELAYEGDQAVLGLIEESVDKLARGLAMMINIFSVNVITISGGMCIHEKLIINPLPEKIRGYGYPAWAEKNEPLVLQAKLGSYAPMVGAAFLDRDNII